jgi:putative ABC transport system ATP-binding protein
MSQAFIELRNLHYGYREGGREHPILRGASAEIGRGEFVALFGRSGSGKTSLLNLLGGLDVPAGGEIVIDGVALDRLDERRRTLFRRRHIGFVYQFFNLLPTLTVAENILLPLELNALPPAARRAALALLAEVGLGERAGSYPDRLSGGEQQRVALVRALAHDPALILADEPTGNLDDRTGAEVLDLLDRMVRARGKTLLTVTHSPEVADRADRVLYLRDGALRDSP